MDRSSYDSLLAFLTAFPVVANREKGELLSQLKPKEIGELLSMGILAEEKVFPTCPDGSPVVDILKPEEDLRKRGKYLLRCQSGEIKELSPKEYENKFTVYRVMYPALMRVTLEILDVPLNSEPDIMPGFVEIADESLAVVFLTKPPKKPRDYFRILSRYIQNKKPIILIGHDKSFDAFLEIVGILPLGNLVYFVPFSLLLDKRLRSDLAYWIESNSEIEDLERRIINSIQPENFRKLMVSVETNPRYLLSLLSNLKTLKLKNMPKFDEYFENTSSLAFRYLYGVDITFGGSKNRGVKVPDSIVFIRDPTGSAVRVIGIVDAKSSLNVDFRKELTEKYVKYLSHILRSDIYKAAPLKPDIPFIFVLFRFNLHSLIDLHGRLMSYIHSRFNELEDKVYTVVVPVDTLEILLRARLSIVLREGDLSESGLDRFFLSIFTKEYLKIAKEEQNQEIVKSLRRYATSFKGSIQDFMKFNRLYILPPEIIITELEKLASEYSSLRELVNDIKKSAEESKYYFD